MSIQFEEEARLYLMVSVLNNDLPYFVPAAPCLVSSDYTKGLSEVGLAEYVKQRV